MHILPKQFLSESLPYAETGKFPSIILDYLKQAEELIPFFSHTPGNEGIKAAIEQRQQFGTNRALLVAVLEKQYAGTITDPEVKKNIELLKAENTFTVCTAHQPNIFTGHLYFIYKILHTIRLAEYLNGHDADNNFVPMFYMGSEDADLEELGHIYLDGVKYEWHTKQTGAVGRMWVDEHLVKLIEEFSGQLTILPFGPELVQLLKRCYVKDTTIQQATFLLIDSLFKEYGLIVLIPDNPDLKRTMLPIFEEDLFDNMPSVIVEKTTKQLSEHYKVQAHPREINLFYLKDNIRSRIIKKKDNYYVENTDTKFSEAEIRAELNDYPERFSPNVILRGLYQETILPNLAFIGGGGELSYWLELKNLFEHYSIPFPVLILRNSFMFIDQKIKRLINKLDFDTADLFKDELILVNELVKKESTHQLYLSLEKQQLVEVYTEVKKAVHEIDVTLKAHTDALMARCLKGLEVLEHKMLKAEKRKFLEQQKQIEKIKAILFPNEGLQERVENFMPYFAKYGKDFIKILYEHSAVFQQKFCVLTETPN